jgi:4-hydroxy-3-polyprenylbenzoate decarboxylase
LEPIIVALSGASGTILAIKTIKALIEQDICVELIMTQAAKRTALLELGEAFSSPEKIKNHFNSSLITVHSIHDIGATIASGSYKTSGMVIVPCSISTAAAICCGLGDNLLRRAADVTLKEKRRLVLVPREVPLSTLHLENLTKLSSFGAVIMPPQPAWYHRPQTMGEMEDHLVGRILDLLGISNTLAVVWKGGQ